MILQRIFPISKYDKLDDTANVQLNTTHKIVLGCFLLNFVVLIFGVIKFSWYITEIAGIFTLLAIVIAFAGKISANKAVNAFMQGAGGILSGALIIGVARAIVVVLTDGHVIDTLLFHASSLIHHFPPVLSAVGMYFYSLFFIFCSFRKWSSSINDAYYGTAC